MPVAIIYFDLGNVILNFSHDLEVRQMAQVAGVDRQTVRNVVFEQRLHERYERGELGTAEFYETFCCETNSRPSERELMHAASNIFQVNRPIAPLLHGLRTAGNRLGLLSNTCPAHWNFIQQQSYGILHQMFAVQTLSFEVRAWKPEPAIFEIAACRASCDLHQVVFIDDRSENVRGALDCAMDAIEFQTVPQLAHALNQRGIAMNY